MTHQLELSTIADCLAATIPTLNSTVSVLPDEIVRFRPAAGEWCVNEVIGHLIEAEQRGFAGRIRHMLVEEYHQCSGWDPDQVAIDRRDDEGDAQELLEEFAALRQAGVALVHRLDAGQLDRLALHPTVGEISVSNLLHEWVYHDLNHLKQIASNVQLFVWSSMGNAQRFSS
ncbi:MAG: DinB family protein [Chloroflexota bacterium]